MIWNWFFVQCQQHKNAIRVRSSLFFILQVFHKNCENSEELNRAAHNVSPETSGRPSAAEHRPAERYDNILARSLQMKPFLSHVSRKEKPFYALVWPQLHLRVQKTLCPQQVVSKVDLGLNSDPVLKRLARFNIHRNTLSPGDLACLCCFYFLCPVGCWH